MPVKVFDEALKSLGPGFDTVFRFHAKKFLGDDPWNVLLNEPIRFRDCLIQIFGSESAAKVFLITLVAKIIEILGVDADPREVTFKLLEGDASLLKTIVSKSP